ncbi:hypothetical protein BD410DRAFT_805418 [Rickenella mellea]|uniref:HAD-like protein n=1 Tax=Rickenella mellea TaxID=50990 RepID=A0A4Y7PXU5_9AGAM|nr:hypothetical protein BD410DRAFT_805418 [Rickenella mellea]
MASSSCKSSSSLKLVVVAVPECLPLAVTLALVYATKRMTVEMLLVLTARSITLQCRVVTRGGIVMEHPVSCQPEDHEKLELVPRLQVLACSSADDKNLVVEKLKELGEIVGVTGDGTNDGPERVTNAPDIILMDDNFALIVKAISVNITAVIVTFVKAVANQKVFTLRFNFFCNGLFNYGPNSNNEAVQNTLCTSLSPYRDVIYSSRMQRLKPGRKQYN